MQYFKLWDQDKTEKWGSRLRPRQTVGSLSSSIQPDFRLIVFIELVNIRQSCTCHIVGPYSWTYVKKMPTFRIWGATPLSTPEQDKTFRAVQDCSEQAKTFQIRPRLFWAGQDFQDRSIDFRTGQAFTEQAKTFLSRSRLFRAGQDISEQAKAI